MEKRLQYFGLFLFLAVMTGLLLFCMHKQERLIEKETFSLQVQTSGVFERAVVNYAWTETSSGREYCNAETKGIMLQGDSTVYPIRNNVSFSRGDSVFISDEVALKKRPTDVKSIHSALMPQQKHFDLMLFAFLVFSIVAVYNLLGYIALKKENKTAD